MSQENRTSFEEAAGRHTDRGVVAELWQFLAQNKRWWMIPIVAALLIFGVLIFLSSTAVAPFIYTLF